MVSAYRVSTREWRGSSKTLRLVSSVAVICHLTPFRYRNNAVIIPFFVTGAACQAWACKALQAGIPVVWRSSAHSQNRFLKKSRFGWCSATILFVTVPSSIAVVRPIDPNP